MQWSIRWARADHSDEERLANQVADAIAPRLVPSIEHVTLEGKSLLLVEVFPSSLRPHYIKSEGREQGSYVRLGSSNRQAGPELVAQLRRSAMGVVFDELPVPDLGVEDLDLEAARRWFAPRALTEQELLSLRLLTREQGRLVPTKGAVLLFGKSRDAFFPDAWVQCGRFRGRDKSHIFDHTDIRTNLPDSVEQVTAFLKKHAYKSADLSDLQRKDVWSIPLLMLREAIVNALVHADYSQAGSPVRVAFFDDRIEVESPGILVPGMTIEDMKQGVSNLRNRVIARTFRELGLIEQWGSGVRRIFSEAAALGLPEPAIAELGMHLRLTIYLKQPQVIPQPVLHDTSHFQPAPDERLESRLESKLAARIVLLLNEQPRGKSELAKSLGHQTVSGELHKQVRRLLELGWIEMTLPDKPQSRLQKYRLTELARQALASAALAKT
nr:helix-turn-helix domain-containing protein [Malikia spinosa]